MKKSLTAILALFTILFGAVSSCQANVSPVVEKDCGYISVNASSTKEISPNQAEIYFNIETYDKNLKIASAENKAIADKVYSALKSALNTEKGDYIKTQGFSANPQYIYNKENKRVFDKYLVSNNVVVRTKNTAVVPNLIDIAIANGATNVNNLQFSVTDYDAAANEILADLTKKTYCQATAIANSISTKIVGIKSIDSSFTTENNERPMYKMMAAGRANDSSANTPIESGKIKVYANINASFYVK